MCPVSIACQRQRAFNLTSPQTPSPCLHRRWLLLSYPNSTIDSTSRYLAVHTGRSILLSSAKARKNQFQCHRIHDSTPGVSMSRRILKRAIMLFMYVFLIGGCALHTDCTQVRLDRLNYRPEVRFLVVIGLPYLG